jgi:hypothetical protein
MLEVCPFSAFTDDQCFVYGMRTVLILVGKVDKLWQIYGIAQDVDRLFTVFC